MDSKSLGNYTLTRQLDHADQIEVYEALDSETNRPVLIKILDPTDQPAANPKEIREFRDKVTALRHPYIASVYDIDRIDRRLFVVMEHLDDTSLSSYLAELRAHNQAPPLTEISQKLGLIADALDHAHAQGLVHRNLNPNNILLTDVDEPVLTDFGLVTLLLGDSPQFKPDGSGLGWPAYISPEQAGGQPGDRLSDLYALGVILYELVTGHLPFEADSPADMLAQQRHELPPPPRTFKPDLPEAAQAVILQALSKEPGRRFTGARELSQAFAAALAETPAEPDRSGDPMPQAIGRYQLEADLGQRGSLIVYRAHDTELERQVAVKILSPQFVTGTELRTRFQREVEVISALAHPCIVEVYDFGEVAGRPYVVMPYLAGGTLETRLQSGPLDLQTLTPIIERIAAALDEAHAHHIVHAQLMPSNILFDGQDQAYLSDFSIPALSLASTDLSKQEGAAKASKYLSPEQIQALLDQREAQLDARSDVYALGVTLFEALTGQTPYQADTAYETAMAHLTAPIPSLHSVNPDLPESYQMLIDRTLAKEPAARYPTAGTIANHMRDLLAGRWYLSKISSLIGMKTNPPTKKPLVEIASPSSTQAEALSGLTFGRYQLKAELGRGGMGVVYLAYDPKTKRQVAIKVLLDHLATTSSFRQQFQHEARLIARLDHEYIAPVYDFGEYNDQLFIVIPYLSGGTLADRLARGRGGRLKSNQIAPVIERVAAALDAAHRQGVVHQDVKPGNILFNARDEAFLSDFGIAVTQVSDLAEERAIGGTPKYMSPEQLKAIMKEGTRKNVDGRSDLYALGIVLFEMLTGRVPYSAGTPREIARAHLTQPVPRLREIKPNLPAAYQEIIDRALAKEPAQRYQTGQELAEDVRELTSGQWYLRHLMD